MKIPSSMTQVQEWMSWNWCSGILEGLSLLDWPISCIIFLIKVQSHESIAPLHSLTLTTIFGTSGLLTWGQTPPSPLLHMHTQSWVRHLSHSAMVWQFFSMPGLHFGIAWGAITLSSDIATTCDVLSLPYLSRYLHAWAEKTHYFGAKTFVRRRG